MTFWLQAGAFAIVAGSLLHGGMIFRAAEPPAGVSAVAGGDAAAAGVGAATASSATVSSPTGTGLTASSAGAAATPSLASAPVLESAQLALSTIDVIVTRNDTLDRIFRRLKLNLTDLASLRSLPGVRTALDSLRPGELLHFKHHDGALFSLDRRRVTP